MSDPRFPVAYANELIRDAVGVHLSYKDINAIRIQIADVLGMSETELAIRMADRYQELQMDRAYGVDQDEPSFQKIRRAKKAEDATV